MAEAAAKRRHDQVKQIFADACLRPRAERHPFVAQACRQDDEVRREVESLLDVFERHDPAPGFAPPRLSPRARGRFRRHSIVAGRYRVERLVERGGMGEVYAVTDQALGVRVALKTLLHATSLHRQRMLEEVRLARQVTHPGVCRVFDLGEHDGVPFLTMELIAGEDLATRLTRIGPRPGREVIDLGLRLCDALAAAHDAGVLHRDLKPANILLDREGALHITDFGIASGGRQRASADRAAPWGTPAYMAPEELTPGGAASERTDLYSIGLVLYELLVGAPPFDSSNVDLLKEQQRSVVPPPPSLRAAVDARLEALILRLLAKEPSARPDSARAVAAELAAIERSVMIAEPRSHRDRSGRFSVSVLCRWFEDATSERSEYVRLFQARCAALCQLRGGRVERHLDDGLLVAFDMPHASEEIARYAVQASLEILDEVRGGTLALEAGSNTAAGAAILATPAVAGERARTRRGSIDHHVRRLQGMIERDAVVASGAVVELLRGSFVTVPLETPRREQARGAGDRRVLGRASAELGPPGGPPASRFTGRELELLQLLRRSREARDGRGQVVLVSGEPGIGKSRLVEEVVSRLRGECVVLFARCSSVERSSPLAPLIDLLERTFGLEASDSPETRSRKLRRALAEIEASARATSARRVDISNARIEEIATGFSPWLASHSGAAAEPTAVAAQPSARKRFMHSFTDWMLAQSEDRPVLFVCEDLHWSDPTTLETLGELLEQAKLSKLLVVLTCRPTFAAPWIASGISPLALHPLDAEEARSLAVAVAGDAAVDAGALDTIVGVCDGNPLFIEELVRTARETGRVPSGHDGGMTLPIRLQALFQLSLDRLGEARAIAEVAAVCGRTFSYTLLVAVAGEHAGGLDLDSSLALLLDSRLLFHRGARPHTLFTFRHALVRDAVYQSIPPRRKQRLHARVAETLPRIEPQLSAERPEIVAAHWSSARERERAFAWWQRAGEQALQRSAYREAAHALEHALAALRRLNKRVGSAAEPRLRLALAKAQLGYLGQSAPAVERNLRRLERSSASAGVDDQIRVLLFLARFKVGRAGWRGTPAFARRLDLLCARCDDAYLRSNAYALLASLFTLRGRLTEADRWYRRCLDSAARVDAGTSRDTVLDAVAQAGIASALRHWLRGSILRSEHERSAALATANRLGHALSRATVGDLGAALDLITGNAERAATVVAETIALAESTELLGQAAMARMFEACLAVDASAGAGPQAIARLEAALDRYRDSGWEVLRAVGELSLARAREDQGEVVAALEVLERASHRLRARDRCFLPEVERRRGELCAKLGRHEEAATAMRAALRAARRDGSKTLELRAAASLARFLIERSQSRGAQRLLARTLAALPSDVDVPERGSVEALLAQLATVAER